MAVVTKTALIETHATAWQEPARASLAEVPTGPLPRILCICENLRIGDVNENLNKPEQGFLPGAGARPCHPTDSC